MAKKYKFSLDGVLKLREFKEHQAKVDLGKVNTKIQEAKKKIEKLEDDIGVIFSSLEESAKTVIKGKMLHHFPEQIEAKRIFVSQIKKHIRKLEEQQKIKIQELLAARGETKVMSKMKEKHKTKYDKEVKKKMNQDLEDLGIISKSMKESL